MILGENVIEDFPFENENAFVKNCFGESSRFAQYHYVKSLFLLLPQNIKQNKKYCYHTSIFYKYLGKIINVLLSSCKITILI